MTKILTEDELLVHKLKHGDYIFDDRITCIYAFPALVRHGKICVGDIVFEGERFIVLEFDTDANSCEIGFMQHGYKFVYVDSFTLGFDICDSILYAALTKARSDFGQ